MNPKVRSIVLTTWVLPLVMLVGLRSAWAQYACSIDGVVRQACCCHAKKAGERSPAENGTLLVSRCCEVTVVESSSPPSGRELERWLDLGKAAFASAAALLPEPSVCAANVASTMESARPPPRAVPIYLAHRSILR